MISDDDLTPAALRNMEAKLAAREAAMFADEAGMPTEAAPAEAFDDLDDDGNDALTGQPVLSSWLASQPWAQDDGGEPVQLAANAAGGTASDAAPDYWEATKTIGKSLAAQVPAGLAGMVELARGNGMEEAAQTIEGVTNWLNEAWNVMPQTPEGRAALEKLAPLMEKLGAPAQAVGGAVHEATGSAAAATAAEIVLDPLNYVVPAVGIAAKGAAKAAKAIPRAGLAASATAGATVATSGDAEALPLTSLVAKAIRSLPRTAEKPEIEAAMLKADPKMKRDKAAKYANRAASINRETGTLKENDELWRGKLGVVEIGNPQLGGYHVMLEHHGDLLEIVKESGMNQHDAGAMGHVALLKKALDVLEASDLMSDGTRRIGRLNVKIVGNGPRKIGTLYIIDR